MAVIRRINTLADLEEILLSSKEDEHLEFKEARASFSITKLIEYCVAFANLHGGQIVFGVTDRRPRKVVGSMAFDNVELAKKQIFDALKLVVDFLELAHIHGRVVVVTVPSRQAGDPIEINGRYLTRVGESLVAMRPSQLRRIFQEVSPGPTAMHGQLGISRATGYLCGARISRVRKDVQLKPSHLIDLVDIPSEGLWRAAERDESEVSDKHLKRFSELTGASLAWLKHGDEAPYSPIPVNDFSWESDLKSLVGDEGLEMLMVLEPKAMSAFLVHQITEFRVNCYQFTFGLDFWRWIDDHGHIPRIWKCMQWIHEEIGVTRSAIIDTELSNRLEAGDIHGLEVLARIDGQSYWFDDMFDLDGKYPHLRSTYKAYGKWFNELQRAIKRWA